MADIQSATAEIRLGT